MTDRPARRRPALASRIAATGLSSAATLGMVGAWGITGTPGSASTADPIVEQQAEHPKTIVVRIVRRRAAVAPTRVVRTVSAPRAQGATVGPSAHSRSAAS